MKRARSAAPSFAKTETLSGRELRQLVMRAASGSFALRAVSIVLGFATTVVLSRALGAEGYGAYAWAIAWLTTLRLPAILGFDRLLIRNVTVYAGREAWSLVRGVTRFADAVVLTASLTIAGAGALTAWLTVDDRLLRVPLVLALAMLPFTALTALRQGSMQGHFRIVAGQVPDTILRPFGLLIALGAWFLLVDSDLSAAWATGLQLGATAAAFIVAALLMRRSSPAPARAARPSHRPREWVTSALPMFAVGGMVVLSSQIGIILLGALRGAEEAGIYGVAARAAALLTVVLVAMNAAIAPVIARLHETNELLRLQDQITRSTRLVFAATALVALPFLVAPGTVLGLFGDEFSAGATALRILALGFLANAAAGPNSLALIMTGRERESAGGVAVGAALTAGLAAALIPGSGVVGAAVAAAIGLAGWNALLVWRVRLSLELDSTAAGLGPTRSGRPR